jgi:hypothetical protein
VDTSVKVSVSVDTVEVVEVTSKLSVVVVVVLDEAVNETVVVVVVVV